MLSLLTAITGFLVFLYPKPPDKSNIPHVVIVPLAPVAPAPVAPAPGAPAPVAPAPVAPAPVAPAPGEGGGHLPTPILDFTGDWINVDKNTRQVHRLDLRQRQHGQDMLLRAWGACHPTDCDWGEINVSLYPVGFDASKNGSVIKGGYSFPNKEIVFTIYKVDDNTLRLGMVQNKTQHIDEIFERAR